MTELFEQAKKLKDKGYSLSKIGEQLGIAKTTVHRILKKGEEEETFQSEKGTEIGTFQANEGTKIGTFRNDEGTDVGTFQNGKKTFQNSDGTHEGTVQTTQNTVDLSQKLSQLPENVRILVENLVSPADVELSAQERQEEVLSFIVVARKHLKSKELYRLFKDTITDLSNVDFLTLEDIDGHIVKLKYIIKEMEDLYSHFQSPVNKREWEHIYYLPSVHSKSILRYLYSMKMHLKRNGEDIGEIPRESNPIPESWLSLEIKDLFPFTYDTDCSNIELSLGI